MAAGRPQKADPGTLYAFAHQFYWDFRRLAEGGSRWRLDEEKYQRLISESENVQLDDQQKSHLEQYVEDEVRAGRLDPAQKQNRLRDLEESTLWATRTGYRMEAGHEARKQLRIPGEPDVLDTLLKAEAPEQVRLICEDAFVHASWWSRTGQSPLVAYFLPICRNMLLSLSPRRVTHGSHNQRGGHQVG